MISFFMSGQGVNYSFKSTIELDAEYEVIDIPFWTLPKEEQAGKVWRRDFINSIGHGCEF